MAVHVTPDPRALGDNPLIEGLERGTLEAIVVGVCLAVALRLSTAAAARGRAPQS